MAKRKRKMTMVEKECALCGSTELSLITCGKGIVICKKCYTGKYKQNLKRKGFKID